MSEWIEEMDSDVTGGGRGAWKEEEINKEIEKMIKKVRNGGKKVFRVPVKEALDRWHIGEIEEKYEAVYLVNKLKAMLTKKGVVEHYVHQVTRDGKKAVIVNLAKAKIPEGK